MRNPNTQIPNKTQIQNPKPEGTRKPYDIRVRTFEFALRVLEIAARLPNAADGEAVRRQLIRAGTSVGANVEEADGAVTKLDTRKCFVTSRKEAREARYWLRLIDRRWPDVPGDPGEDHRAA